MENLLQIIITIVVGAVFIFGIGFALGDNYCRKNYWTFYKFIMPYDRGNEPVPEFGEWVEIDHLQTHNALESKGIYTKNRLGELGEEEINDN